MEGNTSVRRRGRLLFKKDFNAHHHTQAHAHDHITRQQQSWPAVRTGATAARMRTVKAIPRGWRKYTFSSQYL